MRQLVRQPLDLIENNVCVNFRITFKKLVIYDFSKFMIKNCYIAMNVRTENGLTQIRTFNFSIKDNETEINWNSVVRITNPTKEVIDFYLNNQIQVSLMVDEFNVENLGITRKINNQNGWSKKSWVPVEELSNSEAEEIEPKKIPSKFCNIF